MSTSAVTVRVNPKAIQLVQILLGSCLIGILAQIKIPLFFTPVPLTLGTIGVMLAGTLLGSRKGALAAFAYLAFGLVGLPVWAGGAAGFAHFMGPTGGYLLGYIPQAFLIGWCLERGYGKNFIYTTLILIGSVFFQLALGSLWLAQFVGIEHCLSLGFYPFVIGDSIKGLFVAMFTNRS